MDRHYSHNQKVEKSTLVIITMTSSLSFRGKIFIKIVTYKQCLKVITSAVFCFNNNYRQIIDYRQIMSLCVCIIRRITLIYMNYMMQTQRDIVLTAAIFMTFEF